MAHPSVVPTVPRAVQKSYRQSLRDATDGINRIGGLFRSEGYSALRQRMALERPTLRKSRDAAVALYASVKAFSTRPMSRRDLLSLYTPAFLKTFFSLLAEVSAFVFFWPSILFEVIGIELKALTLYLGLFAMLGLAQALSAAILLGVIYLFLFY